MPLILRDTNWNQNAMYEIMASRYLFDTYTPFIASKSTIRPISLIVQFKQIFVFSKEFYQGGKLLT